MYEPPHPEAGADDERTASFGFLMAEMSSFQGAMSSFQAEMSSLQFASSLSMFRTSESFGLTSFESQDSVGRVAGSRSRGNRARVSVIVTARNYGAFLKDCLESVHQQSVPADEIIYSDDGSEDESLEIAERFPRVKVLGRRHEGIAASRNAAAAASTGDLLVHVDGDDMLAPDFLECHRRALEANPEASFAYGPADAFGLRNCHWKVPFWSRSLLWVRNYVNTSAMYRRWAFEAAGGWRTGVGHCFDWDLALRASRFGPAIASDARLHYRQHAGSWSRAFWKDRFTPEEVTRLHGRIRQMAATVTVGCVYSGRLPQLLPDWLGALARSVRTTDLPRPKLLFVDGTPEQSAGELLLREAKRYPEFRQFQYLCARSGLRPPFRNDERNERARFMANACNQILDESGTDVVWFLEDDLLPPENAYARLLHSLLQGRVPRPAVAGVYRSRHDPQFLVAHQNGTRISTLTQPPSEAIEVDMTGTGCLMVFRPYARHRFTSHVDQIPAHDWAWCLELKRHGRRVLLDPEVQCRHFVDHQRHV